jgi:hypothetical protein
MRNRQHRVIREVSVPASQTFTFDIETKDFDNLLITWSNDDTSVAAPTAIIACVDGKRATLQFGNFPNLPVPPLPGYNAYAAIGPSMLTAIPMPDMITIGVITPAGVTCSIKVSGDIPCTSDPKNWDRS